MRKKSTDLQKFVKGFLKKLSIIDLFFLIFLGTIGIGFFLFFFRKAEFVTIRVKVTNQEILYADRNPKNWYAERFVVGDAEKDTLGNSITEILNVESFPVNEDEYVVFLDLKVKATYDSRTDTYSFRGKTLSFGTPVRFSLSKITFDGIVTEFPGSVDNQESGTEIITFLGRDLEPALAESLKIGDSIYNSNGDLLLEVTDVSVVPAEKVVPTDDGNLLLRRDPLYKDLKITTKASVRYDDQGRALVFDYFELKVGTHMPLNFIDKTIYPMIFSFEKEVR